jgi:hypothetical protein
MAWLGTDRQLPDCGVPLEHTDAALTDQLDLEAEGHPGVVEPGRAAVRFSNRSGDVMPTIRAEMHRLAGRAVTATRRRSDRRSGRSSTATASPSSAAGRGLDLDAGGKTIAPSRPEVRDQVLGEPSNPTTLTAYTAAAARVPGTPATAAIPRSPSEPTRRSTALTTAVMAAGSVRSHATDSASSGTPASADQAVPIGDKELSQRCSIRDPAPVTTTSLILRP